MKSEKTPIRGFFAIKLPKEIIDLVSETITNLKKMYKRQPIRWIKQEHLHITLQFLETIEMKDIDLLIEQVRNEVSKTKSFLMNLNQLELFPGPYKPQVISFNLVPHDKLADLAQAIGRGIQSSGYAIETRPFRGHLTVARIKSEGTQFELDNRIIPTFPEFWVKEITLVKSMPTQEGSNYFLLETFNLSQK